MPSGRQRGTGTPTALKVLRGGHPELINNDEPKPEEGWPDCPSRDPEVREVWDYTLRQLDQMKTASKADRDLLHAYCVQVVQHRRAEQMVLEDGIVIMTSRGPTKHPAVAVMQAAGGLMTRLAANFGLTPQGRSAIRVGDQRTGVAVQSAAPAARLLSG